MRQGFMYLFVIIDLYGRYIVLRTQYGTGQAGALGCLKRAFQLRKPEIVNSDQCGQFTNEDYINLLQTEGTKISMDEKGRALVNIFVERVFPVIKV
jgi:putative transposase